MKYIYVLLFLLSFSNIQAQYTIKQDSVVFHQNRLAFELSQLYAIDQTIRSSDYMKVIGKNMVAIDSLNFEKFISFVKENGFPNKKMVGDINWAQESVGAVGFVYMVHNPKKVAKKYYELFKSEIDKGNLNPELFAYALDRYFVSSEGRSYFNTPYKAWASANGVCLQDKEKSNNLRLDIGLEPLPDSVFIDCSKIELSNKPNYRNPIILNSIPN